jgi:capsular polysaccharide biosynthesis protein
MFLDLIQRKKQTIFVIMLLFMAATLILTLIQPLKYRSSSKMLVIQEFPQGVDPYTVSKSNMYISNLLAQVVETNSFYNEVMDTEFNIDKNYFLKKNFFGSQTSKIWEDSVDARAIDDTGIIEIFTYHPDRFQNEQLAQAVNFILKTRHQLYHSTGENITLKVINEPSYSTFPVKPNIALNFSLSIMFGFMFSLAYIYLLPGDKYNIRIIPGKINPYPMVSQNEEPYYRKPAVYNNESVDRFREDLDRYNLNRINQVSKNMLNRTSQNTEESGIRYTTLSVSGKAPNFNNDKIEKVADSPARIIADKRSDEKETRTSFKGNMKNVIG